MNSNLTFRDIKVLTALLKYRILAISQLAYLCFPSKQMARKKIREYVKNGLIERLQQNFNGEPGRPENVYTLTQKGIKIIRDQDAISFSKDLKSYDKSNLFDIDHQLLLNWIKIHLQNVGSQISVIHTHFLSQVEFPDYYTIDISVSKMGSALIPDGIFSITNTRQSKSLLFFLEIDMGTEALSSANPGKKDIRKKVLAYQFIFKNKLYSKFEKPFNGMFNGFRTLFVTNTSHRSRQISRLVKSFKMTDFIWITDKQSVFKNGISAEIWTKGGKDNDGRFSILGNSSSFNYRLKLPK